MRWTIAQSFSVGTGPDGAECVVPNTKSGFGFGVVRRFFGLKTQVVAL